MIAYFHSHIFILHYRNKFYLSKKEGEAAGMRSRGKLYQAEGTVCAKALRWAAGVDKKLK